MCVVCEYVCVCVHMRACVRACVRVCVCVCVKRVRGGMVIPSVASQLMYKRLALAQNMENCLLGNVIG